MLIPAQVTTYISKKPANCTFCILLNQLDVNLQKKRLKKSVNIFQSKIKPIFLALELQRQILTFLAILIRKLGIKTRIFFHNQLLLDQCNDIITIIMSKFPPICWKIVGNGPIFGDGAPRGVLLFPDFQYSKYYTQIIKCLLYVIFAEQIKKWN